MQHEAWLLYMAGQVEGYVQRRNQRYPRQKATLADVCKRFRYPQKLILQVLDGCPRLALSDFVYADRAKVVSWLPQLAPDAPAGQRLVSIVEE